MNVFYVPDAAPGSMVTLDENESSHCTRVLRLKAGNQVTIFNGQGGIFEGTIVDAHPKKCTVSVMSGTVVQPHHPGVHIAIAPTKAIDRFEWFIEKSIEIGISQITPLLCNKSERKQVNNERLERLAVSAMKQSMQPFKTLINQMCSFPVLVGRCTEKQRFIAHCEDMERQSLKSLYQPGTDTIILIGPEGDFTTQEIIFAGNAGFKPVSLGQSRLRTETAGLVACHSVLFMNQ